MRNRYWRSSYCVLFVSAVFFTQLLAGCVLYTTRPIQSASTGQGNQVSQQFDSSAYTQSIWASKVVPTVINKSVELQTVLTALKADTTSAEKRYAALSSDGFYNFMVKGQGLVTDVNTSSRTGILQLQLSGVKDPPTIILQIGPVITGSAIRDSVGFINFNQFANQVQYAEVADKLNARIAQELQGVNFASLKGKTITFYGAFTFIGPTQLNIVPIKIIEGGKV